MSHLVTLLTDFGLQDSYVAQMKGVMLAIQPDLRLIDITHQIPPQQIATGARILAETVVCFPKRTVHLAVVDPGVGTDRPLIAVVAGGQYLVGPDNGLLSLAARRLSEQAAEEISVTSAPGDPVAVPESDPSAAANEVGYGLRNRIRVVRLENPAFWRSPVSNTFHGRDIMAPVAAWLARGVSFSALGTESQMQMLPDPAAVLERVGDVLSGKVVAVDHFGNLITDLRLADSVREEEFPRLEIECGGVTIRGLSRCYGEHPPDQWLALRSSQGELEIALNGGHAAARLQVSIGTPVRVRIRS